MDSTAIFYRSYNISFLEVGHSSNDIHFPQITITMLFSSILTIPSFVRILPGSIGDVFSISRIVDMASVEKYVTVTDEGFFTANNIKGLLLFRLICS